MIERTMLYFVTNYSVKAVICKRLNLVISDVSEFIYVELN